MGISRADFEAMQARTMAARGELTGRETDEPDSTRGEWTASEIELQDKIHDYAQSMGAIDLKCLNPGKPSNRPKGEWDHIQLWPGGRTVLIEVKKRRKKRTTDQRNMHAMAVKNGFESYLVKTFEGYLRCIYARQSEETQEGVVVKGRSLVDVFLGADGLDGAGAGDRAKTD